MAGATESSGTSTIQFYQEQLTFDTALVQSVTQYNGAAAQNPDPTIEAFYGVGNVPAFRGTTYIVLKGLKVNKWGGTIPGFEGLVEDSPTRTVGSAIGALIERSGRLTSDDYDISAVSGDLLGLALAGVRAPREAIQALMLAYDVEVVARGEVASDGTFHHKLVFFDKENAVERTVADADRGAHAAGADADPDVVEVETRDPSDIPTAVSVSFLDSSRDYQPGSQTFRRAVSRNEHESRVTLPLTLTPSNALFLAKKIAWMMHLNERLRVRTTLPPTYVDLTEADIIVINDAGGEQIKARVTKVDRGANHLVEVEALEEQLAVYEEPAEGETPPG